MSDSGTAQAPPSMRDAAQRLGLGTRMGLVADSPNSLPWGALIGLSLLSVILLTVAVTFAVDDQRTVGAWYHSLPLLILAMVPPVILAWILVSRSRNRMSRTWIAWHEGGVVYHKQGFGIHAYAWDRIASVVRHDVKVVEGLVSTTTHQLHVRAADGLSFTVNDDFAGMVPFAEGLTDAFSGARVPQDAARLEAGECLQFGSLDMTLDGVGQEDRHIGWGEVERIDVKHSRVQIHRRGQLRSWLTVPAPGFPNLMVFLTLADALRRSASDR
ncbi:DUF6585 family protein [Streptomyces sp. NPDC051636]|uniref:DUF6585 family protein n=1 Tax=Streptomyces sp. NPDC051636 TaxID=3365663 RepID=UPI0037B5F9D3